MKLKRYYKDRYDLGARAFTVAFDDMEIAEGQGKALAEKHAEACRTIHEYLKAIDPACVVYFCPVPYGGPNAKRGYVFSPTEDAEIYLKTIGEKLPQDVLVYWTGLDVFSPEVDTATTDIYAEMVGRKPFFWDNDSITWCDKLEPFHGRPGDFVEHVAGYVGNVADREDGANAALLPVLLTISDYLWNPRAYDSEASMRRAKLFLGEKP